MNIFQKTKTPENTAFQGFCVSVKTVWRKERVCIYSATKTVLSLAVGLALEEGLFKLDDKAINYFPECGAWAQDGAEEIRIRHLLTMSSGKRCFWFGSGDRHMDEKDWAELFWRLPQREAAGQRFFYSNSSSYIIGRILAREAGMSLREFLLPRLFKPLKIMNPLWATCPLGYQNAASALYLKHEQFSRIGHILLHKGEYEGRRLIPADYLSEATEIQVETQGLPLRNLHAEEKKHLMAGYGYHLWIGTQPRSFRADGKYGQFILVYPEQGYVVTLLGHEEKHPYTIVNLAETLFS